MRKKKYLTRRQNASRLEARGRGTVCVWIFEKNMKYAAGIPNTRAISPTLRKETRVKLLE
jgi:hypothetical protein